MLKSIRTSLRDSVIYGFGNIAVKVVGLVLIPLYTDRKYFTVDDFGILGLLEITGLVLTAFLASALPQSLTRWYWDKEYADRQKGLFFMTFATQVVVSVLFCLALIPLSEKLSLIIFQKPDWSKVLTLVILASAIQSVNNIVNSLMRLQSRSVLYTITNLVKLAFVLLLTVYLIVVRKMGLEGIFLAQVIGNSAVVIFLSAYVARNSVVYFSRALFGEMNRYGFPLFLANIASVMLNVVDRYSLNSQDLLKSVALYTLALKITSVLKLVIVDSLKLAVGPLMFRKLGTPDAKRFYSKVLLYSSFVLMAGIIGISLFSYEVIKVMARSKEFWGAVMVVPLLAISVFFINMKDITIYGLHFEKKTRTIGSIVVASTVLAIILNLLLIPPFGITGAALATLLSQVFYWLACHYFAQRVYAVPYEMKKIAMILVAGSILAFSSLFLNGLSLFPRLAVKAALLASYPFILYLAGFYEEAELTAIRGFFRKWSNLSALRQNIKSLKDLGGEI